MPTERFYRLPKEKAEAIRLAAIKEFKRVPPEEVSINKIIQDADISRGSFYTYFKDKKELLNWLVQDLIKNTQRFYVKTYQENGGDVWDMFSRALPFQIEQFRENDLLDMMSNVMQSASAGDLFQIRPGDDMEKQGRKEEFLEWLYRKCDKEKCPLLDKDEFRDLVGIHMICLMIAMKQVFKDGSTQETVKHIYERRLRMVRYGVVHRQELQD